MLNPRGTGSWQRTSPVAIAIFVGRAAKWVYNHHGAMGQFVVAVGAVAFLLRNPQYAIATIAAALLLVLTVGILQYWFFRFRIEDDRILIRQGVLKRTATAVPFERIQGINVDRRLAERLLGLVTVALDTPGAAGAEGELPAVAPEVAERLLAKVAEHQGEASLERAGTESGARTGSQERFAGDDEAGAAAEAEAGAAAETASVPKARRDRRERRGDIVQQLGLRDVLRLGVASPGVFLHGVVLALLFSGQLDAAQDRLQDAFEAVAGAFGEGARASLVATTTLLLGLLFLILAWRVGSALVRHHGYTLWDEGSSYRSRAGLITRREMAVGIRKVQQLRLYQSLWFRCFGRYRLRAPTIGMSIDDIDGNEALSALSAPALEVPWADDALVERMRSGVLSGEAERLALLPGDPAFRRVSPIYIRAVALRLVFVGAPLGALALFFLGYIGLQSWDLSGSEEIAAWQRGLPVWGYASAVWGGLCVTLAGPIGWLRWRARAYTHDDDGLACRSGLIGRSVAACVFRKAQGVVVRRSPLQRRHGLATIEVETACGDLTVSYIAVAEARRLRDHIAYRVESSNRRWY